MGSKKIVLITGASRGIGKALSEKFSGRGHEVIGTSTFRNRSSENFLKLDLSSSESIADFVKSFGKLNRKIDIFINNAGIWPGVETENINIQPLRKILEVNLIGTIDLTEKLIPYLNDGAKVINISSSAGSISGTYHSNYADYKISKAALNMYTATLSRRLLRRGITVASIHPGWVKTDMGGPNADIEPRTAAEKIYRRVISLNIEETGEFWFGQEKLPW